MHTLRNSCTTGRPVFITGQSAFRSGVLRVGLPGAKEGLSAKDPTIAEVLRPPGYKALEVLHHLPRGQN
jgi:arylsulfatase A-like enzyme